MLYTASTLIFAQQVDTRPPFWWMGLFASPGGLLIVGSVVFAVIIFLFVILKCFKA